MPFQLILNAQDKYTAPSRASTASVAPTTSTESATLTKVNAPNVAINSAKKEFKFSFFAASSLVPIYILLAFYSDAKDRAPFCPLAG